MDTVSFIRQALTRLPIGRNYLIIMILVVVFFFLGYAGHSYKEEDRLAQMTQRIREQAEQQYEGRIKGLEKRDKDKDILLRDSRKRERVALDRIMKLTKERENVELPQTDQEIIDRLNALGYKPSSVR